MLTQECVLLERKIDAWATGGHDDTKDSASQKVRTPHSGRDVTKDLPDEVAAFEVKWR